MKEADLKARIEALEAEVARLKLPRPHEMTFGPSQHPLTGHYLGPFSQQVKDLLSGRFNT